MLNLWKKYHIDPCMIYIICVIYRFKGLGLFMHVELMEKVASRSLYDLYYLRNLSL
jgi:hypothetical protein